MKFTILTLFPEMFSGPFSHSMLKIAQEKRLLDIKLVNIRDFGIGAHKTVDDTPYGGGEGMVMRVDVIKKALDYSLDKKIDRKKQRVILLSASGKTFTQRVAEGFINYEHIILICGHYEGIDNRITNFIDEELSIGNYVLTGGEIPAMVIVDTTARLVKGVLKEQVTREESHSLIDRDEVLLEYPHYTRPENYEGQKVPQVLLSGNHAEIRNWRIEEAKKKTIKK